MSRILEASKRTTIPNPSASDHLDHEPILLDDDPRCAPASPEMTPPRAESEVPFVEIPEPNEPQAPPGAAEPQLQLAGAIRFRPSEPESGRQTEMQSASVLTGIARQAQLYQNELDALWDQIHQARARSVLLVSALPGDTARPILLTAAWRLAERTSPMLLVETPGDLALYQLLARPAAPGWSDWLAGLPLPCVIQATPHPQLHYLGPGNFLACVHHCYLGHDWQARWTELGPRYQLVLLLASSASPWAFALSLVADAVCFLVSQSEPHPEVQPALLAIQAAAAKNLGYLFVRPTELRSAN